MSSASPDSRSVGAAVRATFPRSHRLLKRGDFQRVQRSGAGRRFRGRHLVVLSLPNGRAGARFGLVVSRKVGNAVVRNQVKRWLREAVRGHRRGLTGQDVVLIARSSAATAGLHSLECEVVAAFAQLQHEGP